MDETGFRIDCERSHRVVTRRKNRALPLYIKDPDNREYTTLIEAVSAGGDTVASFIILQGEIINERAIVKTLLDSYYLATSDIDYTNDEIQFEWIH